MPAHRAHMTVKVSQDTRLHTRDVWHPVCLKMQTMVVMSLCDDMMFYYCTKSSYLFILYMI